jgi:outer membrane protein TolC
MKKLKIALLLTCAFHTGILVSQDAVTLPACYENALNKHPYAGERQIQYELWQIKDQNIATGWYPSLDAGANIIYNSNVVSLSDDLSAIPIPGLADKLAGMPHDQYKITLDINQVIWDGGAIKNSRILEEANKLVSEQDIEIELYKIREKVNSTFFGLILLKSQKDLLNTYLELVTERLSAAESGIENGMLLSSDKSSILAEKVKLRQQLKETEINIRTLCTILSDLCGIEILPSSEFILPEVSPVDDLSLNRPELLAFDYRLQQLDAGKSIIRSSRMPKAFGFASLGYGSPPGMDFFNDDFGPYAVVGAGVTWKIFDWNKSKRNIQKIELNKNIVSNRKTDLEENLNRALISKYSEIKAYASMLVTDRELIDLRISITLTSESQFSNGTITSTEYMSILNLEKEAILSLNIHEINFLKSQVEYLNISGNEIK